MSESNGLNTDSGSKAGVWTHVKGVLHSLNTFAGLLNVIIGVIGALFLVNEWQNRQTEARIKAIEALSGSASQSRAAILYLVQIGADLSHQNLTGVNASGLHIQNASMSDVRLDNADLTDASIAGDLSAVSVRCADVSNLSLNSTLRTRPIDARGARIGYSGAAIKSWGAPALYTPRPVLEKLGKNIGQGMKGEIMASDYLRAIPGAKPEESLPYCLYDRLKSQGATHEDLCRGLTWDGIGC
jgi:hypothetical protein